jgi:uncharacterized CHY-type Zn-finger protein
MSNGVYFCPHCHRRIETPKWLKTAKLKVTGKIVLTCGNCKRGKVTINGNQNN